MVACYPRYPKKEPLTLIVTDNKIPCLDIIDKAKSWALICSQKPVNSCSLQSAPRIWTSLNAPKSEPCNGWPRPYPSHSIKDTLKISAKIIPIFSDSSSALFFHTTNYSGLIIDSDFRTDTMIFETFKEKLDLLIVCNQNSSNVKILRSVIRPRFLISNSQPDQELKRMPNVLFFKNSVTGFEFRVQSAKKLILNSRISD